MRVRGTIFWTLYIKPYGGVFRVALELPEIYNKEVELFTKSAFCKEFKGVPISVN